MSIMAGYARREQSLCPLLPPSLSFAGSMYLLAFCYFKILAEYGKVELQRYLCHVASCRFGFLVCVVCRGPLLNILATTCDIICYAKAEARSAMQETAVASKCLSCQLKIKEKSTFPCFHSLI